MRYLVEFCGLEEEKINENKNYLGFTSQSGKAFKIAEAQPSPLKMFQSLSIDRNLPQKVSLNGATILNITTFSRMRLSITIKTGHSAEMTLSITLLVVKLIVIMLGVAFFYCYADTQHTKTIKHVNNNN